MRSIVAAASVVAALCISASSATSIHTHHQLHKMHVSASPLVVGAAGSSIAASSSSNPLQCLGNLSDAWYTGVMAAHAWMEAATQDCVNKTRMQEDPHACQDEIVKGAARLTEAAADIRKLAVACNRSNTKCGDDLKEVGFAVQNIASDSLEVWLSCKKHINSIKQLDECLLPLFNMTAEAKTVKKSLLAAVQNCGQQSEQQVSIDVEKKKIFVVGKQ